ncbi:MAG TPA: asparagine synthase-related protein [Candidatus Acidoferrum sp.]|nr:asparagine synthase-related protein [Candidatus Acidoferrum sp.]
MPGFTGIIRGRGREDGRPELDAMVECMMRERSYRPTTCMQESLGLWVGCIANEQSSGECLPVWNVSRDVCLIFHGELYEEQNGQGETTSHSQGLDLGISGRLLSRYEATGFGFLEKLNGWFSGLLIDLREQKVVIFNDRYGIGRVHYHENKSGFYFSSEAKSILTVIPDLRELDLRGLGEILTCGCVLQNRTLFSGVSLLPPGSAWTFTQEGKLERQCYFSALAWERQPTLTAVEFYERLKETWRRILPRYFHGQEPLGLSLTGGVDSRMILAWAKRAEGKLPCYTFGGSYRDCADVTISREVARICHQRHEVIPVGKDFLSQFPTLAEKAVYISDGAIDVTGSIDLYVQAAARQIAPVRVTGTNGGEILRGLVAFAPSHLFENLLAPEMSRFCREAVSTYEQELDCHRLSFTTFKQAPWFLGPKFVLERSQINLRMPYFDNDLIALVYQAPHELAKNNEVSRRLIRDANPALGRLATDRGEGPSSIPGYSRMRHLLHELTFKAEYAYDYGMPQWLARCDHALGHLHLDRLFLGRHKFSHFRIWYRHSLAQFLADVLLDPRARCRPYLRPNLLERIVERHINGHANHTLELHRILALELLQRVLLE